MQPRITVVKNMIYGVVSDIRVRVVFENGGELVGSVPFGWDQVSEKIAEIEIQHPQYTFRYTDASKYIMYNSTVVSWDYSMRETCLHVGLIEDGVAKGHIFHKNGIVQEAVFDLNQFSEDTRNLIIK